METLIDSSVLIAAERGQLDLDNISARYAEEDIAISAVTASELLHGVHRARTAAQRHRRQAFVEGLMAQLPVIAFDLTVARVHASLWSFFFSSRRRHTRCSRDWSSDVCSSDLIDESRGEGVTAADTVENL